VEALQQRGAAFASEGFNALEKGVALQERTSNMRAQLAYKQRTLDEKTRYDEEKAGAKRSQLQTQAVEEVRKLVKDEITDFDTYKNVLKKNGFSDQEADSMAMAAVNQGFENSKVREAKKQWQSEEARLNRESRERISVAQETTKRARTAIIQQRAEWQQKIDRGEVIKKSDLMRYKVQLMKLRSDVEYRGIKGIKDTLASAEKMQTNYLGVSALDRTGEFKNDLTSKLGLLTQTADAGLGSAKEQLDAIDAELATIEGMIKGAPSDPIKGATVAPAHEPTEKSINKVPRLNITPADIGDPNVLAVRQVPPKR
jgi:hypothetical protein